VPLRHFAPGMPVLSDSAALSDGKVELEMGLGREETGYFTINQFKNVKIE
jgi:hypothetical protein